MQKPSRGFCWGSLNEPKAERKGRMTEISVISRSYNMKLRQTTYSMNLDNASTRKLEKHQIHACTLL
jgi:hypothetical protein